MFRLWVVGNGVPASRPEMTATGRGRADAEGGIVIAHAGAEAGGVMGLTSCKRVLYDRRVFETVRSLGYDQLISVLRGEFEPEGT